MEHWKTIKGHPNYAVSDSGKVKNISTGEQRKPVKIKNGYLTIAFADCGKHTLEYLHRLVANEFAPNPHGFTVVNHKDRNKENCCASNLEWCTTKYNVQYSVAKPIGRYDMEGNFIDSFFSVRDAEARQIDLLFSHRLQSFKTSSSRSRWHFMSPISCSRS